MTELESGLGLEAMTLTPRVLHEIQSFTFAVGTERIEQITMVRTLGAIKRRLAGFISYEVFFAPQRKLWVVHSAWSADQDNVLHGLTPLEAEAILRRIRENVELMTLDAK